MSLLSNDEKVHHLFQRWSEGSLDLKLVESLLIQVIDSGAWKSFHTPNGNPVTPLTFRDFIAAEPYQGLGATPEKVVALLGDNNDAVVKMRKMLDRKGERTDLGNNVTQVGRTAITGNRRDYALDRLTREHPDLRAQVDAGELSAHAAAVQAGFRPRTFTVRADDPEKIAATLRRQLPEDVLELVVKHLRESRNKRADDRQDCTAWANTD